MLKVFYPFNPHISIAMTRIRRALMDYRPPEVVFVRDPRDADLHILDFIGQHPQIEDSVLNPATSLFRSVPSLPVCSKYVILLHCHPPAGSGLLELDYSKLFERAVLVVSYLKPEWMGSWGNIDWSKVEYYLTPWGYDGRIFVNTNRPRDILCLMTGYVAETEKLIEVWSAAAIAGGETVHVGGNIGLDGKVRYRRLEGITDKQFVSLLQRSKYVNAIRLPYGFELVGIEGAACGAQPIYLDLPCYRYWFGDIGLFVDPAEVMEGLAKIFAHRVRREGFEEKVKRFEWGNVAPKIWEEILRRV